jgi:hypothetical protein
MGPGRHKRSTHTHKSDRLGLAAIRPCPNSGFQNAKYTKGNCHSWKAWEKRNCFLGSTTVDRRCQVEIGNHEIHQMFPTLKVQVASQGAQVIKEGFTDTQFFP